MSETHTKTGEGTLVDVVRESPVDQYLLSFRRKVLLVVLLIVIVLAVWCFVRRGADEPAQEGSSGYAAAVSPPEVRGA
jgi:hypothetical protein